MTTRWNYFTKSTFPQDQDVSLARHDADSSSMRAYAYSAGGAAGGWGWVPWLIEHHDRGEHHITFISTQQAIELLAAKVAAGEWSPPREPIPPNPDPTAPDPDLRDPKRNDYSIWNNTPLDQQPAWNWFYMQSHYKRDLGKPPLSFLRVDPNLEPTEEGYIRVERLDKDGYWYRSYMSPPGRHPDDGVDYVPIENAAEADRLIRQAVATGFINPPHDPILPTPTTPPETHTDEPGET
jgi:hypothetical protein